MEQGGQPREIRTSDDRATMVERQLRSRGISDPRVLAAIGEVPRERFVAASEQERAYGDGPLPIGLGQTISQPYMVARMTELLEVEAGARILEIGTGSGYQAAILARLGASVSSIERLPELAESARERLRDLGYGDRVVVVVGDGSLGDPAGAPWDGIIVTAGAPTIPGALRQQLMDGGRLVVPVGTRERQELVVVRRSGDSWIETSDGPCVFVPLIGEGGFSG